MGKVLVSPLNWGLGHATRCVPLIRRLAAEGHEVVLAADGIAYEYFSHELPDFELLKAPAYHIRYSEGNSQIGAMLRNLPGILRSITREHVWLKNLLAEKAFDMVVSDNRFGLWNKNVRSVYMTHQLMIKMPQSLKLLEPLAAFIHRFIIGHFDECWIPDYADNRFNLSGDLSHKYILPPHAKFIDPLSRFSGADISVVDSTFDIVVIISGPEPQRTVFEKFVLERYIQSSEKILVLQGMPNQCHSENIRNITLLSHLDDSMLAKYLLGCRKIISRSGYSTIMDLNALKCLHKTEFYPTPGQTEQEYLASIHKSDQ